MVKDHHGKKNPFFGKHHSEESKKKNSEAHKGIKNTNFGKHRSEEIKEKIRLGNKGKHRSEEFKRKNSEIHKGRIVSEETKRKISQTLKGRRSPTLGKHLSEEEKRRISESTKGAKSHLWKGGLSFEPYTTDWTKTLKRSIRERDHYQCQLCGQLQSDRAFAVHHIDYNKKNCNPDNLITLCIHCHIKTNENREIWEKHFKEWLVFKTNER